MGDPAISEFLGRDRQATRERIADLRRDLDQFVAGAADANGDNEHDPEGATVAYEREQTAALLASAHQRLADIDAALAPIEGGIYGRCLDCGRPIDPERLRACPTAERCRACA